MKIIKVYCIMVNGQLSQEGYDDFEKAINFVENRSDKPVQSQNNNLMWIGNKGNVYTMYDINIV